MARIAEYAGKARRSLPFLVVVDDLAARKQRIDVAVVVHDRHALALRVLRHDAGGIAQDKLHQVLGRRGQEDLPLEAFAHELRCASHMVEMRMRDDERVDGRHVVRERRIHLALAEVVPLLDTAVDKQRALLALYEEVRARHGFRTARERQFERHRYFRIANMIAEPTRPLNMSSVVSRQ